MQRTYFQVLVLKSSKAIFCQDKVSAVFLTVKIFNEYCLTA